MTSKSDSHLARRSLRHFLSEYGKHCFALSALRRGLFPQPSLDSSPVELQQEGLASIDPIKPIETHFGAPTTNSIGQVYIYIGSAENAYSPDWLKRRRITHIVNASFEYDCVWAVDFTHDGQRHGLERLFSNLLDAEDNAAGSPQVNWKLLFADLTDSSPAFVTTRTQLTPRQLFEQAVAARSSFDPPLDYCFIPIRDALDEDVSLYFDKLVDYMDSIHSEAATMHQDRHVLFHCKAGVSRSVTLALVYLMKRYHISANDAFMAVRKKRPKARPNMNFALHLLHLHRQLFVEETESEFLDHTLALRNIFSPPLTLADLKGRVLTQ